MTLDKEFMEQRVQEMEYQELESWIEDADSLMDKKGFGKTESIDLNIARSIGLMHSELSELLECHRVDPNAPCDKPIPLTCEEEECADIFLRLMHYCGMRNINLGRAAAMKHFYNETREHKHGKKF